MTGVNRAAARAAAFVRLGRPHFLAGGVVLHALGVALALVAGARFSLPAALWGQVAISATQWMTHYANDYFDLAADRANHNRTSWSGGSGVLPAGLIAPRAALATAAGLALLAVLASLVLALRVQPAPLTLPLLWLALGLAWSYSGPPLRLHASGLGEFAGMLTVAGLTPLVGFYLQVGRPALLPLLAAAPLCCLQLCMLIAVDWPDAEGDTAVGKRTLVVRRGRAWTARLYILALLAAYVGLPAMVAAGLPWPAAAGFAITMPLAALQARRVMRGDWQNPAAWNGLAFGSVALLMIATAGELAGCAWWLWRMG